MEDYKGSSMVKLSEGFMALYGSVEMQKQRLAETYRLLEGRQQDMVGSVVSQLELDEGEWSVDAESKMLVKKTEDKVNGDG